MQKPWVKSIVRAAQKELDKTYRQFQVTRTRKDWIEYTKKSNEATSGRKYR